MGIPKFHFNLNAQNSLISLGITIRDKEETGQKVEREWEKPKLLGGRILGKVLLLVECRRGKKATH